MALRIVIDDAIAWHADAFGQLGELYAMPGPAIDRAALHRADALIVRTVTRVTPALLEGTPVRFVGSASAGEDHIDRLALEERGITVAKAPGCNAQAVAEYVLSVLAHAQRWQLGAPPGPVGVVGLGHVGRRTARALRAVGYDVLACDPPLGERRAAQLPIFDPDPGLANMGRYERLGSLEEVLESSFVITVHVPLVPAGPHCTWHLLDEARLSKLRYGQLVINTSRGGVVDDAALHSWITNGSGRAVLDVWEDEPRPRRALLERPGPMAQHEPSARPSGVLIGTPHVAGYSLEGKVAGTRMVHEALCKWMGRTPSFDGHQVLGTPGSRVLRCDDLNSAHDWRPWIVAAIPFMDDDAALRAAVAQPDPQRNAAFEALRRGYALRRELSAFRIDPQAALDPDTHHHLTALGITVGSQSRPSGSR